MKSIITIAAAMAISFGASASAEIVWVYPHTNEWHRQNNDTQYWREQHRERGHEESWERDHNDNGNHYAYGKGHAKKNFEKTRHPHNNYNR